MEKYRYGTKEIIATVIGVGLLVFARWLEIYFVNAGMISDRIFDWFRIRVLVVSVIAVFFGPICGALCGVGGNLLLCALYETSISYPEVFVLGLYGFILGLYFGKTHYDPGRFTPRTAVDFNVIQMITSSICSLFIVPLLQFLFEGANVYAAVIAGAKRTVGNCILVGIVCTAAMFFVSLSRKKDRAGRRA